MVPHPKSQSARARRETYLMIDAFRQVETELHHRLIDLRTIPAEWHEIHARRRESHPRRTRITARLDADVVRFFKGLGPGYQWRMNEVLRAYMHGRLAKIVAGPDTTDYILHPERIPEEPEAWEWGRAEAEMATARGAREGREAAMPPGLKAEEEARMARAEARYAEWKKERDEAVARGEEPPPLL